MFNQGLVYLSLNCLSQLLAADDTDDQKRKALPGISWEKYMKQMKEAEIDQKANKSEEQVCLAHYTIVRCIGADALP